MISGITFHDAKDLAEGQRLAIGAGGRKRVENVGSCENTHIEIKFFSRQASPVAFSVDAFVVIGCDLCHPLLATDLAQDFVCKPWVKFYKIKLLLSQAPRLIQNRIWDA